MREVDIKHESGQHWVGRTRNPDSYTVYRPAKSGTHSEPDSSYPLNADGLSLAKARCDYMAARNRTGR